jgi:uncharacterized protein (TIGR02646 family)
MIRVPAAYLPVETLEGLKNYQDTVDGQLTYALRVAVAKSEFQRRNIKRNKIFRSVHHGLDSMCRGARRCMYCEDSVADEIEHYRPKDLYPELVFAWGNYLYSCGPCNGPKRNFFAIFANPAGEIVELNRQFGQPITEPPVGHPLLIDPRTEDPLTLLRLDIIDTFLFQELHAEGTQEHMRAKYTVRVLHLNDREFLRVSRENAFIGFRSMLRDYVFGRDVGKEQAYLDRIKSAILHNHHPTVWAEMKRQKENLPELKVLFEVAPEALVW